MISIFIFFLIIPVSFSCWGGYDEYPPEPQPYHPPPKTTTPKKRVPDPKRDAVDRNIDEAWGGFKPPPAIEKKWRDWQDDYKKQRKLEAEEGHEKYKDVRGPNSGWPPTWVGMGGGFGGAEPPPWAYVPINVGLPEYCYLPLAIGKCDQKIKRFAFNPFIGECAEFIFSGCGENQNNFQTYVNCEQSCMKTPISGCNPETQMYIET